MMKCYCITCQCIDNPVIIEDVRIMTYDIEKAKRMVVKDLLMSKYIKTKVISVKEIDSI